MAKTSRASPKACPPTPVFKLPKDDAMPRLNLNESPAMGRSLTGATAVTALVALLALQGCTAVLNARESEAEVQRMCALDGGLRVYEKVPTAPGRFPTVIPDAGLQVWQPKAGAIFGNYRYEEVRGPGMQVQGRGRFIYRDTVTITRISDGKVMGELVSYRDEGDEILHGIRCPEKVFSQKLIDSVFEVPGDPASENDVYPTCPGSDHPKTTTSLQTSSWQECKPDAVSAPYMANNTTRKRGVDCDERTKIDDWYDKTGKDSVGLVGTRLLFEGPDGHRCQALAMRFARRVKCSESGIEVRGLKGASAVTQNYSSRGELLSELEVRGAAPASATALLDYRETAAAVTVDTAQFQNQSLVACYRATAPKPIRP
jgi:hypothetical protein